MNMIVFFPGKMCSNSHKNHNCGQKKKTEGTSSAIFTANSSVVPTDIAAEPTTKIKTLKAYS